MSHGATSSAAILRFALDAARDAARELNRVIDRGEDPNLLREREEQVREQQKQAAEEAQRLAESNTFGTVRERFLHEYKGRGNRPLKPKTRRDYTRILRALFDAWDAGS